MIVNIYLNYANYRKFKKFISIYIIIKLLIYSLNLNNCLYYFIKND